MLNIEHESHLEGCGDGECPVFKVYDSMTGELDMPPRSRVGICKEDE